jgi:hypothetical protein
VEQGDDSRNRKRELEGQRDVDQMPTIPRKSAISEFVASSLPTRLPTFLGLLDLKALLAGTR